MKSATEFRELGMEGRRAIVQRVFSDCERVIAVLSEFADSSALGWKEYLEGSLLRIHDQPDEAAPRFERSEEYFRQANDLDGLVFALNGRAWMARHSGQWDLSHQIYSSALDLATQRSFLHGQATVNAGLAVLYGTVRRTDEAVRHFERSLSILDTLGETFEYATIETDLASLLLNMDPLAADVAEHLDTARKHYEHALSVFTEYGSRERVGVVTAQIGYVHFAVHDYNEALRWIHRGLAILYAVAEADPTNRGVVSEIGVANALIGEIHMTARNLDTAREYTLRALGTLKDQAQFRAQLYMSLGIIAVWSGMYDEALASYRASLEELRGIGVTTNVGHALINVAHCQLLMGDPEGARASLTEAARYVDLGNRSETWRSIVTAKLAVADGMTEAAREQITSIYALVEDATLKWERVEAEIVLRDIALAENNLPEYVKHNDLVAALNEDLRGVKTQRALTLMEQERKVEAERQERERERAVLFSALPKAVADRVIRGEKVNNDHYDNAAVIFLDIAGFTRLTSSVPPGHVIHLLDAIFNACDDVMERHNVTKIKTIGDSYMAVAFPDIGERGSDIGDRGSDIGERGSDIGVAERAAAAALDLLNAMDSLEVTMPEDLGDTSWIDSIPHIDVRIGIHIGPVVAGVIGSKRLQYDVWGDTVNTASRMESTGEPGRVQVSDAFARALCLVPRASTVSDQAPGTRHFALIERGEVSVKGKGTMTTYWLERA